MMPKRVAETDPNKQIDDYTGSGPFIFKKDEWKPGEKVVYVKNTKYKPRAEPPSMLAGGKVVKIDRLEWIAITDPLTAVNALQQGEIDLIEMPVPDLFPMLKADKNIALYGWNALGSQIIMRFNHLHPPFNNVKARQAAMYAIAQEDFLRAAGRRSRDLPRVQLAAGLRLALREELRRPADQARLRQGAPAPEGERL